MSVSKNFLFRASNTAVIYTVFSILFMMQKQLGLEAMLEYHRKYLQVIEKNNPTLKHVTQRALSFISIEKIYSEAFSHDT